jgi:hypothetical protein
VHNDATIVTGERVEVTDLASQSHAIPPSQSG